MDLIIDVPLFISVFLLKSKEKKSWEEKFET